MFIADLHLHSRYSRATSPDMCIAELYRWARMKGIGVIGTGDFTHPQYFREIKEQLEPLGNGLFRYKDGTEDVLFMLTTEVSNVFSANGKGRRVHTLIFAPSFEVVEKINAALGKRGDLMSDGRPTFGFHIKELVKLVLDISEDCLVIPAHIWTPWYGVLGANGGFDSLEEAFEEEVRYIYAIETGLSSDASMNWRLSALDKITLISNSDAHSPHKLGREANIFLCDRDYFQIAKTIKNKDRKGLLATIEFYPQEGKYHYDGHRKCDIVLPPKETIKLKGLCPVCHRPITVGVMHRIEKLADRPEGFCPPDAIPEIHLIPLEEIIAEALGKGVNTKAVQEAYFHLTAQAPEFDILLKLPLEDLASFVPSPILEGIKRVRAGQVQINPGYDGIYGKIRIFPEKEDKKEVTEDIPKQGSLF